MPMHLITQDVATDPDSSSVGWGNKYEWLAKLVQEKITISSCECLRHTFDIALMGVCVKLTPI